MGIILFFKDFLFSLDFTNVHLYMFFVYCLAILILFGAVIFLKKIMRI